MTLNQGQFKPIENIAQKKLLEAHQANEHTRLDKHGEGICYLCFKRDYVWATVIDVCYPCATKRGPEAILAIIKRIEFGFCYVHGGYCELVFAHNLAHVNVRLCMHCTKLVAERYRVLARKGTHGVDPFWKSMRRKFGKDYEQLLSLGF